MNLSTEIKEALELTEKSDDHFFITGKAGTGKSTLIQELRKKTKKRVAVLAPTGVAAVNIKGQTIHSFFGFKPGVNPDNVGKSYGKKKIYKKLDALIIDEISMVRADLLDCVGLFLQKKRYGNKLFGGVQMIMVGDLYQLPPVLPNNEKDFFKMRYESPYFFSSKQFKKINPQCIKLRTIHRQSDPEFISILNKIRSGKVNNEDLDLLNRNTKDNFNFDNDGVFLTTTNKKADRINQNQLEKLSEKKHEFKGRVTGNFPKSYLPTKEKLILKKGAKVMLLNNDSEGRWINGDVGKILNIENSSEPAVKVKLENGEIVEVTENKWERIRFTYNEKDDKIESKEAGSFHQLPLKLSWALTIHKSQGKTFNKAMIDFGRGTFSHGQAYVALSRCTGLENLSLKRPIKAEDIIVDPRVGKFLNKLK